MGNKSNQSDKTLNMNINKNEIMNENKFKFKITEENLLYNNYDKKCNTKNDHYCESKLKNIQ